MGLFCEGGMRRGEERQRPEGVRGGGGGGRTRGGGVGEGQPLAWPSGCTLRWWWAMQLAMNIPKGHVCVWGGDGGTLAGVVLGLDQVSATRLPRAQQGILPSPPTPPPSSQKATHRHIVHA